MDSELILHTTEDGVTKADVTFVDETVWLIQEQMADLFQKSKSTINEHIKNIYSDGELMRKGFVMDDQRLKELGGGGYFKELLERIRDIRASEKVFYRQILEIYATSIDYDPTAEESVRFFKKVQNKIHYAILGVYALGDFLISRLGSLLKHITLKSRKERKL